jgi:hypothetical protein
MVIAVRLPKALAEVEALRLRLAIESSSKRKGEGVSVCQKRSHVTGAGNHLSRPI